MVWLDLSTSIWLHAVIVGSLIPSFVQVRAGRAEILGSPRFVSDILGFAVLIIGAAASVAFLQPMIQGTVANVLSSTSNIDLANVVLLGLEFMAFKWLILNRGIL